MPFEKIPKCLPVQPGGSLWSRVCSNEMLRNQGFQTAKQVQHDWVVAQQDGSLPVGQTDNLCRKELDEFDPGSNLTGEGGIRLPGL